MPEENQDEVLPEGMEGREDSQPLALPGRPGQPAPTGPLQQRPHHPAHTPTGCSQAPLWSPGLQRER